MQAFTTLLLDGIYQSWNLPFSHLYLQNHFCLLRSLTPGKSKFGIKKIFSAFGLSLEQLVLLAKPANQPSQRRNAVKSCKIPQVPHQLGNQHDETYTTTDSVLVLPSNG